MSDKKIERKAVFVVTERDGQSFWTRVGAAFPNKDGSINVLLDALPASSGKLQIRDEEVGDEREPRDRDERKDRRSRR